MSEAHQNHVQMSHRERFCNVKRMSVLLNKTLKAELDVT
jgi:hypothetical protein